MKAFSLSATLRLLCALLLTVAVVAGPCQACFDPPKSASAHDCCPSSKKSEQHQHNSSCSDVQVAVEQTKQELQSFDAITEPAPTVEIAIAFAAYMAPAGAPAALSATPPLLISLRC
jgi:hypothetical protein